MDAFLTIQPIFALHAHHLSNLQSVVFARFLDAQLIVILDVSPAFLHSNQIMVFALFLTVILITLMDVLLAKMDLSSVISNAFDLILTV